MGTNSTVELLNSLSKGRDGTNSVRHLNVCCGNVNSRLVSLTWRKTDQSIESHP
ncbi:hypothetical protein WUBG_18222 [Wuchereria bancrofti]|uniref:Uncharacterized protein n=1 Tax=Wuchereria bancrofti TaxID=6293 RepID=J9E684_WUCBA|nr:hypothetical protein WUBG_18222 [Wuchereria bancrofti]